MIAEYLNCIKCTCLLNLFAGISDDGFKHFHNPLVYYNLFSVFWKYYYLIGLFIIMCDILKRGRSVDLKL